MFSFGELLLIALVSLLVIGPRRLPETVRFVALQAGRLRQTMTATRKMVEDELGMEDIRRQLHNEQIMRSLNATREQIERAAQGLPPPKNENQSDSAPQAKVLSDADTDVAADANTSTHVSTHVSTQASTQKSQPDSSNAPYTANTSDASATAPAVSDQSGAADDAAQHDARSPDSKTP